MNGILRVERIDLGEKKGQIINRCIRRKNTVTIWEKSKEPIQVKEQGLQTEVVGRELRG